MIRSFHAKKILLGEIQDDEDIFNQLMHLNTIDAETQRLPDQEFVIGNKFQKMILRSIFFRHSQPFCFHANYVIGLNRKLEFLIAVQNFYEHGTWPWKLFIRITKSRISSRLMGLSRNLKTATRLNI